MQKDPERPSPFRVWRVAVRPFAYSASVLPLLLGSVLALHAGVPFRWMPFLLLSLAVLFLHSSANLLNDGYDFRRGLDQTVLPGSGAVVRGWLSVGQVHRAAAVLLCAGIICGVFLVWMTGWMLLVPGLAGMALTLGYTRKGRSLKTMGLGDVTIFAAFGLLPVCTAWWVQTGAFSWQPLPWSFPLGLLSVGILHANNWRDIERDTDRKCMTLAVRLGSAGSMRYYRVLLLAPFALVVAYVSAGRLTAYPSISPPAALGTLLCLPSALKLGMRDWRDDPQMFARLDTRTARLHFLFGILLVGGILIDAVGF